MLAPSAGAQTGSMGGAENLRRHYAETPRHAEDKPPHQTVQLSSDDASGRVRSEAFGVIDSPYTALRATLADPQRWCGILILHINNKHCAVATVSGAHNLSLKIARKYDQPVDQAYLVEFSHRLVESSSEFLAVQLDAPSGPLGTREHHFLVEAIPVGPAKSYMHVIYSYEYGPLTGAAMHLYFATVGHGKVGFTEVGHLPNGEPDFIRGARGLAERNTMRYFLAFGAYLQAPGPDQFEVRLRHWFAATEAYPRQLHEIDLQTYLDLKRPLAEAQSSVR